MRRAAVAAVLFWASMLPAQQQPAQEPLAVGTKVPPLRCADTHAETLSWETWEGRAVLLFFHSDGMVYSRRGLETITEALAGETELKDRAAMLLVTSGNQDMALLEQALGRSGLPGRIVVDADRRAFVPYRVVAFPTVFVIGPDRTVVHIAKGFGPLLSSKIVAATKLGAGLIDRAGFEQAVRPAEAPAQDKDSLRVARTVRMARQLVAAGMLEQARTALEGVITADSQQTEAIALLAQVIVRQKQAEQAQPWIDRLAQLESKSNDVRYLRAEVHLQRNEPDAALEALVGLDDKSARVALLKGGALEQKGMFKEAAALYRLALEVAQEGAGR